MPVLIQTFARTRLPVISMFSAVPECEFGCGASPSTDDENANDRHFFQTYCSPSPFIRSSARSLKHHQDSLGSIRPPRGRQSRNESERIDITSIVLMRIDNNTNRPSRPPFLGGLTFWYSLSAGRKSVANPSKTESSQPPKNIRPTRILLGWQKKSSWEISRFKSQKLTLVICSARSAELNPFKSSRIAIPDARKVS